MSQFINNPEHTFGFDTLQLHVGQESADPASDSRAVPIYQTTSYVFRNSQHAADRFGLADAGNIYGRLTNSTQGVFEDRIAALEGGVAGLAVASGAAAITYTLQALAQAGDHVVAQKTIYGGSYNLLEHTLSQFGVETTFVDAHNLEEVEGAIKDNTTVIYLETLGNPNSDIPNIDAISEIAKKHGLPVVVDNTFGTPYLFRPLEHGANIVVHSATKFIGGHGTSLGGVIVDGGNFDWKASGKYARIAEPNPSYHGVSFAEAAGPAAFATFELQATLQHGVHRGQTVGAPPALGFDKQTVITGDAARASASRYPWVRMEPTRNRARGGARHRLRRCGGNRHQAGDKSRRRPLRDCESLRAAR